MLRLMLQAKIKLKMIHTDAELLKPPKMSQTEKEARLYAAAKKLGVKLGGKEWTPGKN